MCKIIFHRKTVVTVNKLTFTLLRNGGSESEITLTTSLCAIYDLWQVCRHMRKRYWLRGNYIRSKNALLLVHSFG